MRCLLTRSVAFRMSKSTPTEADKWMNACTSLENRNLRSRAGFEELSADAGVESHGVGNFLDVGADFSQRSAMTLA